MLNILSLQMKNNAIQVMLLFNIFKLDGEFMKITYYIKLCFRKHIVIIDINYEGR